MKKLLIIGAGGFGRTIYDTALQSIGYETNFIIKGFLDYPKTIWNDKIYPPILGIETEYQIEKDDVFICALGNVEKSRNVINYILNKGGIFINLIHVSARIAKDSTIGIGNIIMNNTDLGSCVKIGDFNLIQTGSIIGHDANIGNFCRIDCNVVCVGGVIVMDEVTIHTSSVVSHGVTIGSKSIVGALSFVIRNVKEKTTVLGNPAIRL